MFRLSINSIEKTIFEDEVEFVLAPGIEGELGILTGHIPLITALKPGNILVRKNTSTSLGASNKDQTFPIERGFMEVRPNKTTILLST